MKKYVYSICGEFICNEKKMLVIRMDGATCVMPEEDYNRIITAEIKYNNKWKQKAT